MANKTTKNKASVSGFLDSIGDEQRRKDAKAVAKLMQAITGDKPAMWGTSMVGFGTYHYKYASGREGDSFITGLSPRKDSLTLYLSGLQKHKALLEKLGKHKTGKVCLYIKTLDDVDEKVLTDLITKSVKAVKSGDWSY